jgi:hypothetical protein
MTQLLSGSRETWQGVEKQPTENICLMGSEEEQRPEEIKKTSLQEASTTTCSELSVAEELAIMAGIWQRIQGRL